jgi:multimeric flavodoxin WrbA
MKIVVFMGSPRENGKTATLTKPFLAELERGGAEIKFIYLYGKQITPCLACMTCQSNHTEYGCAQRDDMDAIAAAVLWADCIILSTPIYIWYCTAPMKLMLDRLFGMCKYAAGEQGENLLAGRKCGIITTCGYAVAEAARPFEDGIKQFCAHFRTEYIGMLGVQDTDGDGKNKFTNTESVKLATDFAMKVMNKSI